LAPVQPFIDAMLEQDRQAPRKQRHTAHRIYARLCAGQPQSPLSERRVRQYVRARKAELGLLGAEVFIPQSYDWGVEGQVDGYEAAVDLAGERQVAQVFVVRSMAGGAAFHRAYPRATQQAFLDAHQHAFHYFGGVFRRLRYDHLASFCGQEDSPWPPTAGNDALYRLSLALAVRSHVLHAGPRP